MDFSLCLCLLCSYKNTKVIALRAAIFQLPTVVMF